MGIFYQKKKSIEMDVKQPAVIERAKGESSGGGGQLIGGGWGNSRGWGNSGRAYLVARIPYGLNDMQRWECGCKVRWEGLMLGGGVNH